MAITINGSGTITGVSTGGLPDGIVDADMLATSAVTSAKILDATIASGDLASGAITSGAMPAGSVLQVITDTGTYGGNELTTSSSFVTTGQSLTITPKYTTSKLLMQFTFPDVHTNEMGGAWAIFRDGSNITHSTYGVGRTRNINAYKDDVVNLFWSVTSGSTSSTTFTVYARRSQGTNEFYMANEGASYCNHIMEIKT